MASQTQILELERILSQIRLSTNPSQTRGYFTQAVQILSDINYLSEFRCQLGIKLIGAETPEKLHEPSEILKNAIVYYKNQLANPPLQKEIKPQIDQTQIRIELEKQIILSENIKLKQAEERRLKLQANVSFTFLAFLLPVLGGIYFMKTAINYETFNPKDPLTWIDQANFGKLEMLIIVFEVIVFGFSKWAYGKYKNTFLSYYYEKFRARIS